MDEVLDYIYGFEGSQREIMEILHNLMMDQPGILCKISYKIPFYYRNSWICYLNPQKKGGIEFAFTRGNELSNEQGLLEKKGRQMVRGITLLEPGEIPLEGLNEIIQEAILLDETVPYSTRYFTSRKKS
jgi:hypothetical protein